MRFTKTKQRPAQALLGWGAVAAGCMALAYGCQSLAVPMDADERLYRAKCSLCHQPVSGHTRTADEWQALLRNHGPKLTEAERAAILRHLTQP